LSPTGLLTAFQSDENVEVIPDDQADEQKETESSEKPLDAVPDTPSVSHVLIPFFKLLLLRLFCQLFSFCHYLFSRCSGTLFSRGQGKKSSFIVQSELHDTL